ncbi:hypothetical protein AB3K78_11770 [Leucobacter sp. HNU]|uniref:hypothetical protein n=1 Tax=Leucobacter sp. HNU TaxID=3236805 RepID=UPI003A7FE28E
MSADQPTLSPSDLGYLQRMIDRGRRREELRARVDAVRAQMAERDRVREAFAAAQNGTATEADIAIIRAQAEADRRAAALRPRAPRQALTREEKLRRLAATRDAMRMTNGTYRF